MPHTYTTILTSETYMESVA